MPFAAILRNVTAANGEGCLYYELLYICCCNVFIFVNLFITSVYCRDSCLSPKVLRLCEVIKEFKFSEKAKVHDNTLYPPLLSGIVFVNRRITAVLLKDIFEGFRQRNTNGYSDIHSGSVVGHGSTSVVPEAEMNIFEQEKVSLFIRPYKYIYCDLQNTIKVRQINDFKQFSLE